MNKYFKYLFSITSIILLFTACTTSSRMITIIDKNTGKSTVFPIIEQIEVKLRNNYNELYNIEDVIIGYKTTNYNPLNSKTIKNSFISSNKEFNSLYSEFSKNGIENNLFQNDFMTFTDDSVLGILAKEYGMKVVTINKKDNSIKELDYKKVDINFSNIEKHNLYNGFTSLIKNYKKQFINK